jgi:ESS family glutamate:Na+ symporter
MSPSPETVAASLLLLGVLLLGAAVVRFCSSLAQRLFLPSSVLAGGLALLLGPEALGRAAGWVGDDEGPLAGGAVPEEVLAV